MDHAFATAQGHYNQAHIQETATAKSYLAKVNKEETETSDPTKESPALAASRQERRRRQNAAARERAQTLLDASKLHASKQNYMGMLKRDDQVKLACSLTSAPDKPTSAVFVPPKKCPAGPEFQRRLYRLIDGGELGGEAQEDLDKCERDVHDKVSIDSSSPHPIASAQVTRTWSTASDGEHDHLRADEKVAEAMWKSLEKRWRDEWAVSDAPPIVMRKTQRRNRN